MWLYLELPLAPTQCLHGAVPLCLPHPLQQMSPSFVQGKFEACIPLTIQETSRWLWQWVTALLLDLRWLVICWSAYLISGYPPTDLVEDRDYVFSIGGAPGAFTLANIVKHYNPDLQGAAQSWTIPLVKGAWLDAGVSMAKVQDCPNQVDFLVNTMKTNYKDTIDFQNDWKLLTLFIGANNICGMVGWISEFKLCRCLPRRWWFSTRIFWKAFGMWILDIVTHLIRRVYWVRSKHLFLAFLSIWYPSLISLVSTMQARPLSGVPSFTKFGRTNAIALRLVSLWTTRES